MNHLQICHVGHICLFNNVNTPVHIIHMHLFCVDVTLILDEPLTDLSRGSYMLKRLRLVGSLKWQIYFLLSRLLHFKEPTNLNLFNNVNTPLHIIHMHLFWVVVCLIGCVCVCVCVWVVVSQIYFLRLPQRDFRSQKGTCWIWSDSFDLVT